jgi:hypothetical protein
MKTITYSLILAALAATGSAIAQDTAYTTPVGYLTTTIGGNVSGGSAGASTFVASTLQAPAVFSGEATASPSGTKVISFAAAVPADLDGSYQLVITNGAQEGWYTTISSSNATSITVSDDFPGGLSANVKVEVRKFATIQSLLGDNTAGLAPEDEVQLLDPSAQLISTVVYADGWFNFVTEEPAEDYIIYPGTSVQIIRKGATPLSLVQSGEVKLTKTQVDIFPGDNWLGQSLATGGTLGGMQFASQIAGTDFLQIVRADGGVGQSIDNYVASDGVMYNFVTEEDATLELLTEGAGYLISRSAGPASTISIPAQTVSN